MSDSAPNDPYLARPPRTLIVDDSEADVEVFFRALRRIFGSEVVLHAADDRASALDLLRRNEIDVLLVDYRLPDGDGLQLLDQLPRIRPMAVILLTGQGNEVVAAQAIKRGAHEYVVKRDLNDAHLERTLRLAMETAHAQFAERRLVQDLLHARGEMDHLVRSLSHDMSANFMVLEHSIRQLTQPGDEQPRLRFRKDMSHVEACLRDSRRFLSDLDLLARTGTVDMEPRQVNLSTVIDDVLNELEPRLAERQISVIAEPNLPNVWCNDTRVRQVISNLVRNAMQHGCHAEQPRIAIGLAERPADCSPGQVWLRVHDNGAGIPPQYRDVIFQPGRRLDDNRPGTGMGLAIVKRIVEHYQGKVFIDPNCRQGTSFIFSLPAVSAVLPKPVAGRKLFAQSASRTSE